MRLRTWNPNPNNVLHSALNTAGHSDYLEVPVPVMAASPNCGSPNSGAARLLEALRGRTKGVTRSGVAFLVTGSWSSLLCSFFSGGFSQDSPRAKDIIQDHV